MRQSPCTGRKRSSTDGPQPLEAWANPLEPHDQTESPRLAAAAIEQIAAMTPHHLLGLVNLGMSRRCVKVSLPLLGVIH